MDLGSVQAPRVPVLSDKRLSEPASPLLAYLPYRCNREVNRHNSAEQPVACVAVRRHGINEYRE